MVTQLIQQFPPESNNCADLARQLLPIALQHDADAVPVLIKPKLGYVCPRISLPSLWFHHVLVGLLDHCVDALTGVDGTPARDYLATHWMYADQYIIEVADLTDDTL